MDRRKARYEYWKSTGCFEQIKNDKYSEDEKLQAIWLVLDMPTHNGITKDTILEAFRWLLIMR